MVEAGRAGEDLVSIVEVKPITGRDLIILEGFPDVGLVGAIAASYLVDKLGFEEVGYIDAELLPPIISVRNERIKELIRIYLKDNLVAIVSDVPIPPAAIRPMGQRIVEWAKEKGAKLILSLSGLPEPNRLDLEKPRIYVLGSRPEVTEMLAKQDGVSRFRDGFIAGIKGVILREAMRAGIDAAIILAQSHYNYPDPGAAGQVVSYLSRILNIEVDVKPLLESAEELKLRLRDLMRRTDQMMKGVQKSRELELPPVYL
ncbi:MAG: proteasome assembly chaperone family protein [Thaumarchaeota archaeon]|nr:MAG: proteasome assembly chaperone family protein [Nitrososphaerota archaeon]